MPHSDVLSELPSTGTCELTTRGRRSGAERIVEIWFARVEGAVHIVGTPGRRGWLANLRANPDAVLTYDGRRIPVRARAVTDPTERRAVTLGAWRVQPWYAQRGFSVEDWVAGAPMVRLE